MLKYNVHEPRVHELVSDCVSEREAYVWLVRQLPTTTTKINKWLRWNRACPPQLSMTLLCLHGNLIYKYTQVVERKGLEHAGGGGWSVILLKVSVFNRVIFIPLFVVGVHSFSLQRQVSKEN